MLLTVSILAALAVPPSDLRLTGVVTSGTRSIALLVSEGRTRVVATGEKAFGGVLVAIAPGAATLAYEGTTVVVKLDAAPSVGRPPGTPAGTAPPPARPVATATAAPEPTRTMSRADVQARLSSELPRLLAETRLVPVREDGRVVGMTVSRLAADSLLVDAGLAMGDVITRINDVDIDGMGTLIGLWPRLQTATELRATVLRNGSPVSVRVQLR